MYHRRVIGLVVPVVAMIITGCPPVSLQAPAGSPATSTSTVMATDTPHLPTTDLPVATAVTALSTPVVSLTCLSTKSSDNHASDIYNSGVAYMKDNKSLEAIACFQEFIENYPDHAKVEDAHYNLGVLFEKLKNYQDAKTHFLVIQSASPLYLKAKQHLDKLPQ